MTEQFQMTRRTILGGAAFAGVLTPLIAATMARAEGGDIQTDPTAAAANVANLERVKVELVKPPFVHAHSQKADGGPKIHEFTLTIEEKTMILDDQGTEVHAMTFNGSVPGPMMVVHQGENADLLHRNNRWPPLWR